MARLPCLPPNWREQQPDLAAMAPETWAALDEALHLAHRGGRYLHWDKVVHRPVPAGTTPEHLWGATKWRRMGSSQLLALRNRGGQWIQLTDPRFLQSALSEIDTRSALRKHLRYSGEADRKDPAYRFMALIDEAHHSSAIEGAATTRRRSEDLIRREEAPRDVGERMVANAFRAAQELSSWARRPLSKELLCEMQATFTEGTIAPEDVGAMRRDDEVQVVDRLTGEVVHQPPAAADLDQRIEELCAFANAKDDPDRFVHPIVRGFVLHYQLAYDHPFADGNGRTARALSQWAALRANYSWFVNLSLSRQIDQAKESYYRSFLHVQTDESDVTYFVMSQLRFLQKEIHLFATHLGEQVDLVRWVEQWNRVSSGLNERQATLLRMLYERPTMEWTVRDQKREHAVTQPTAHKDLEGMVVSGLLGFRTQGRGGKKHYSASKRLLGMFETRPPSFSPPFEDDDSSG